MAPEIVWPDGRPFAFTVFDDTDRSTLENTRPVYDFLSDLGFRTTKSVWPVEGSREPLIPGTTCEDPSYRDWTLEMQQRGFEIAIHNATYHSSLRPETLRGLDRFREIYGHDPRSGANHASNREAIYWGHHRLSGLHAALYRTVRGVRRGAAFTGHLPSDPHYWGDLCRERITYYRNFVFRGINTLQSCPMMPYHDPRRPDVGQWFASSSGGDVSSYVSTLSARNQDQLAEAGGLCVMYTHFGKAFHDYGRLDPRFVAVMERLASMGGWYAPVSEVLDYIRAQRGEHTITNPERRALERRWLVSRTGGA